MEESNQDPGGSCSSGPTGWVQGSLPVSRAVWQQSDHHRHACEQNCMNSLIIWLGWRPSYEERNCLCRILEIKRNTSSAVLFRGFLFVCFILISNNDHIQLRVFGVFWSFSQLSQWRQGATPGKWPVHQGHIEKNKLKKWSLNRPGIEHSTYLLGSTASPCQLLLQLRMTLLIKISNSCSVLWSELHKMKILHLRLLPLK